MASEDPRRRTVIMGAAGRDFHNFNVCFKDDAEAEVVAFTAAQIPGISGRRYPARLAGPLYPEGIPIVDEAELAGLCRRERVEALEKAVREVNPRVPIVRGASPVTLDDVRMVEGRRVLVVEDRPTTTHGGMAFGAGYVAARCAGAAEIVDPRPFAVTEMQEVYARYPHIGPVLPAVGYSPAQLEALERTINDAQADVVVVATLVDLAKRIAIDKPVVRVRYEFAEVGEPTLTGLIDEFLARLRPGSP